jgi:hypothetical protein
MAVTRINNNQISDASAGNAFVGINAATKVQSYSITATKLANNLTYGSDFTVTGNLTVQGNTTAIDTTFTTIEDPILLLASNQSGSPSVDIGFVGQRGTSNNIAFVWDESADEFVTVYTTTGESNTTISIASYADLHTGNANVGGNLTVNGNVTHNGNVIGNLTISGNIAAGNLLTSGLLSASGNVSGANLVASANLVSVGAAVSGNITGGNLLTAGRVIATGNITSSANISGANVIASANLVSVGAAVSGNITGGNLLTAGQVSATGNISGANVIASANLVSVGAAVSGNITGGNLLTAGLVSATGNISGGNLLTAGRVIATGNITSSANISGANVIASANLVSVGAVVSGNVTGGNLLTAGLVSATGNITSSANISGANVIASANLVSVGAVVSGNVTGGNLLTAGLVSATGNITSAANISGGNLTITSAINTGTLNTTGNAVIAGNLFVLGNITYNNVNDLRIEDPVIILGTGPNGAPLTSPDSYDRGTFMEYYTSARGNAWMGWQNSSGNMIAAANVSFSGNDIISVNAYGTFQAGNIYAQSAVAIGNITGGNLLTAGLVSATGNITSSANISGANISGANVTATANLVSVGAVVSGNITGGNLLTAGLISATGNITSSANISGANVIASANLVSVGAAVSGNITGGNLLTAGLISATGNITSSANISGANVTATANLVSVGAAVSGNITGGNLLTAGRVIATGNIQSSANVTGANLVASANLVSVGAAVSGNITGGNLLTAGLVIATGNITGGNLITPNLVSATTVTATGNITGGNVNTSSLTLNGSNINSNAARITINSADLDVDFAVDGDTVANVFYIDAGTGTVSIGSSTQTTNAILAMNATNSFLMPVGNTAQRPGTGVTGMLRFNSTLDAVEVYDTDGWATVGTPAFTIISDEQFNGNGVTVAFTLSAATTTNSTIVSINGIVQIPTIAYSVGGVGSDTLTFTEAPQTGDIIDVRILTTTTLVTGITNSPGNAVVAVSPTSAQVNITGNLVPVSNATQSLGSPTSNWKSLYVAGNTIFLGGLQLQASGTTFSVLQSDGTTPATANTTINTTNSITVGGILNAGANGVGNIGNSTAYFNTVFAKATSAQYADLAENYVADTDYAPGTVLSFGGDHEVTLTTEAGDKRIAGVVSTNPSYVMNATLEGEFVATIALTGRVPTKVSGPVAKGDMMVSAGDGRAIACATPSMGTVIGKALENHSSGNGIIEVVVGRM